MTRSILFGSVLLLLGLGVALPLVADEKKVDHGLSEEIKIEKPFAEVIGKVGDAIKDAGLVQVADIDWSRTSGMRVPPSAEPGAPRLEGAAAPINMHTYVCESEECLKMIGSYPEHALKLPSRLVVFEKDGKACVIYGKPHSHLMDHKGEIPEKVREHHMDLERRIEKVVAKLKEDAK